MSDTIIQVVYGVPLTKEGRRLCLDIANGHVAEPEDLLPYEEDSEFDHDSDERFGFYRGFEAHHAYCGIHLDEFEESELKNLWELNLEPTEKQIKKFKAMYARISKVIRDKCPEPDVFLTCRHS